MPPISLAMHEYKKLYIIRHVGNTEKKNNHKSLAREYVSRNNCKTNMS